MSYELWTASTRLRELRSVRRLSADNRDAASATMPDDDMEPDEGAGAGAVCAAPTATVVPAAAPAMAALSAAMELANFHTAAWRRTASINTVMGFSMNTPIAREVSHDRAHALAASGPNLKLKRTQKKAHHRQ